MEINRLKDFNKIFLNNSYNDSLQHFNSSVIDDEAENWNYVIITASNESQAESYRLQIETRLANKTIPQNPKYIVIADPAGKRIGSGGALIHVLRNLYEKEETVDFLNKKILLIHSGGDSKRIPQYSSCGKLFSPVPRMLENQGASTLFDEFLIALSIIPTSIQNGILTMSGDTLLLFNSLQANIQYNDASALSIKAPVSVGKNHGVFLTDENGNLKKFLHKSCPEDLLKENAVKDDLVDIDIGAIFLSSEIIGKIFNIILKDGKINQSIYNSFVSDKNRLSFYGDFLYPLATDTTLEGYYNQKCENYYTEELRECRKLLWETLKDYNLKVSKLFPAKFIHFGTTSELHQMMTEEISDYNYLNWDSNIFNYLESECLVTAINSIIFAKNQFKDKVYIENSKILNNVLIEESSIVSNSILENVTIPKNVCIHTLKTKNQEYVTRIYGINDNPKDIYEENKIFCNHFIDDFLEKYKLDIEDIWNNESHDYWKANFYICAKTMNESISNALLFYRLVSCTATDKEAQLWKNSKRISLYSSYDENDNKYMVDYFNELSNEIRCNNFIKSIRDYKTPAYEFIENSINLLDNIKKILDRINNFDYYIQYKVYYAISKILNRKSLLYNGMDYLDFENEAFQKITDVMLRNGSKKLTNGQTIRIADNDVTIKMPVRINFGGGWSDTPPYCLEKGGAVLNAAVLIEDNLPIEVHIEKIETPIIEINSLDTMNNIIIGDYKDIQGYNNPYDIGAIYKAALIISEFIPLQSKKEIDLKKLLKSYGGGLKITTNVINIPKGSGLGISSILSAALLKGLNKIIGRKITNDELVYEVLKMEQLMSTGGGWQDQVGGVIDGIKLITTMPGIDQKFEIQKLKLSSKTIEELNNRLVLIYTGQRRLAKNILREIVGKFLESDPQTLKILKEIQYLALNMKLDIEREDIDSFAFKLSEHYELSKKLDQGATNTSIEQIFLSCEDMISGKFICGAGGGGFLQVVLKKGITKDQLSERLNETFKDNGVKVYSIKILEGE